MSSNLKVNTILPSTGTTIGIGTVGGLINIVGNIDVNSTSGISTFNGIDVTGVVNSTVAGGENRLKIETTSSGNPVLNLAAAGSGGHDIFYNRSTNELTFKSQGGSDRLKIAANGDLLPAIDSQYNIGSNTVRFANIYADTLYGDGSNLTGISAGTSLSGSTNNTVCTVTGANAIKGEANLTFDGSGQLGISHTDPKIALVDTTNNTDAYIFSDDNGSLRFQADQNSEASDTRIRFQTDGTERVSIDNNLTILNGNLVVGTSGKGIDFSATGDASSSESTTSMSNELFDDYEVGSWQPTWSPASGSIGYIARHGDYVKIGRTVHCMFAISANGSTSPTGELKITGLPFSATIPNANGPRGGGGVVFPGSGMSGDISKVICSGTTMRIQMNDGSFLQTNNSSISYGYNAAQISGMFSFITAS